MNVGVGEHRVQVVIDADPAAVLGTQRRRIQFAGGIDRGDLPERGSVDGGDVRRCHPAITDDADIILLHGAGAGFSCAVTTGPMAQPFMSFVKGLVDRKSTRLNSSHLGISYAV